MFTLAIPLYQKQPYKSAEQAKSESEQLVWDHYGMVKKIALRIKPRLPYSVSLDDLVSAGLLGLIDAANKFDPTKHNVFKTYAEWRIRGSIMDELRGFDPLTRTARKRVQELEKAKNKLAQENGREASDEEVAKELGWDKKEISKLSKKSEEVNFVDLSLLPIKDEKSRALSFNDNEGDPFYEIWLGQLKSRLATLIEKLPEKQKTVISLYYQEEMNFKEIALVLNVTDSRISQIHSQAISQLNDFMKTEELER